ncbi:MAG: hypothetical protein K8F91_19655, partial [Candidatus Obscuribacterales bacterium]|nr:hypothetical protein [Candidatus Obscuribacterales bacterium]
MSLTRHFKVITVLMPFYCLVSFSSARANNESLPAPITRQAIELYNQGRLADATSLQEKALKQEPSDWLTNAALSYMLWRQANVYEAIRQGREAARLAPRNPVILCNLGLMLQASDDCDEAIDCYRKAIDIEPTSFLPQLGTARC